MKGKKLDGEKIPIGLCPPDVTMKIAEGFKFGIEKYSKWGWLDGFEWSRIYDALQRHLSAWYLGEDIDSESKLEHLAHAGCCLYMLYSHVIHLLGEDDRYGTIVKNKKDPDLKKEI